MKKLLIIIAVILGVAAAVAWLGLWLVTPGRSAVDASFTVQPGESIDEIADRLQDAGVVRNVGVFKLFLRLDGLDAKVQPGTYDFRGAVSLRDIGIKLASGGVTAEEFILLIKEGWGIREIAAELKRQGYGGVDGFLEITGEPAEVGEGSGEAAAGITPSEYGFLESKPASVSLEGYLFPDTYRMRRDAEPVDIVRRVLDNMGRKFDGGLDAKVEASGRDFFDIVTMASVIEREVRTAADRRLVSDIFWRRLEAGMPLQSCATVNYVTGKGSPAVSYEDTQIDSEYNTYRHAGLPVGPIGNPGLDSLVAAAEPTANGYWYFLTDESGTVHYASTLDEHNANKAKYLK
jgi:UPF0755 protein